MKKNLLILLGLMATTPLHAATGDVNSLLDTYKVEIKVSHEGQIESSRSSILSPLRRGVNATLSIDGETIDLKYSGLMGSQYVDGKKTSHDIMHVTRENVFMADIYRQKCGEMTMESDWPLEQLEFRIESSQGNCTVNLKFERIDLGTGE